MSGEYNKGAGIALDGSYTPPRGWDTLCFQVYAEIRMRTFTCYCGNKLFFDNTECQVCGRALGYLPEYAAISALEPLGDTHWRALHPAAQGASYRMCTNYAREHICNWMAPLADADPFCVACRLNETIPNLSRPNHRLYWARLEAAKRHLLYTLQRLRLPVTDKRTDPESGLAFAFLADTATDGHYGLANYTGESVTTGHARGLITINLAEADDVARGRMREQMQERYRTLLGHFRHEIAHYYWDLLVRDSARLEPFRSMFGDERQNYGLALQRYYANGPQAYWHNAYISAYATAHPWEDWAETWAHCLLMADTLETAHDFGLASEGCAVAAPHSLAARAADTNKFGYPGGDFDALLESWSRLTVAVNAINRSMGLADAYPFVFSDAIRRKLRFIYDLIPGRG